MDCINSMFQKLKDFKAIPNAVTYAQRPFWMSAESIRLDERDSYPMY